MNELDSKFFEEYKRVDKICGDLFRCRNGVTTYIEEMERCFDGKYYVPGWNEDYYLLKHIRWVRNQIAHNSSESDFASIEDLTDLIYFRERIIKLKDPLCLYGKSRPGRLNHEIEVMNCEPKSKFPIGVAIFFMGLLFIVLFITFLTVGDLIT